MLGVGYTIASILLFLATAIGVGMGVGILLAIKAIRPDLMERRTPPGA